MATSTHRDLRAWREAMHLVELVYHDTARFPVEERFGLAAQMRRAAVSVPSNIAEGAARTSTREFSQFIGIACGSLAELETQVELAVRLGFIDSACPSIQHANRVGRLVRQLRKSLRNALSASDEKAL